MSPKCVHDSLLDLYLYHFRREDPNTFLHDISYVLNEKRILFEKMNSNTQSLQTGSPIFLAFQF